MYMHLWYLYYADASDEQGMYALCTETDNGNQYGDNRKDRYDMSNRPDAIELVFENMEYIRIPYEYLESIEIDGIRLSEGTLSCNANLKHVSAESVRLRISDNFKSVTGWREDRFEIYEELEQRLRGNDIAYLRLYRADDTFEDIFVPWQECEDEGCTACQNSLQHVTVDKDGGISVRIGNGCAAG